MDRQTDSSNWRATSRFVEGMKLLRNFQTTRDWMQIHTAISEFTEAVTIDPSYNAARFYLGVSQELDGKHEAAVEQFEELRIQSEQPDLELLFNLGLAYFHQYHAAAYRSAILYLQTVMESARRTSPLSAPEEREGYRESIQLLAKAVLAQVHSHMAILPELGPDEVNVHFQETLRLSSEALEDFERRKDHLDSALVSDIGWGIHNAKGHAYLYAGRREKNPNFFEESIKEFNLALEFDPNNYRILSNLGSAHFFLAEFVQKQKSMLREKSIVPEQQQLVLAEQRFRHVLKIKPHYDFAYARLAKVALQRRNLDEAEKYAILAKQNPSEMTPEYIGQIFKDIKNAR